MTGADAGGYLEWYKSFETYYKRSQLILGPPVDDAMPQLLLSQTFDGVHFDSVMVATATPPQEFDLLLVNGYTPQYTHSCIYYKTQETIVGVNVALIGEIPANSDVIIGTLPVGFRPKATCRGVAGSNFSPYGVGSVSIDGNGNINVRFTAAQVRCNFTICFLAAD